MVHYISERFRAGLSAIQECYPDWLVGIRQDGVVMGLEFDHPQGAKLVMRRLYENGVWAIFSTLDPRVLQFKPGILLGPDLVDEILDRTAVAIGPGAWRDVAEVARVTPLIETRGARHRARPHDARPRALGGHRVRRATTASARAAWSRRSPTRRTKMRKGSPSLRSRRPAWAWPSTSGARTRRARAGSPTATTSAITSTPRSTPTRRSSRSRSRPASCSRSRRRRTRSPPSTSRCCWR